MTRVNADLALYLGGTPAKNAEAYDMLGALYQYPHIADRISTTWGDALCIAYMRGLTVPERYTEATALDDTAIRALIALIDLHSKLYPEKSAKHDLWEARL